MSELTMDAFVALLETLPDAPPAGAGHAYLMDGHCLALTLPGQQPDSNVAIWGVSIYGDGSVYGT